MRIVAISDTHGKHQGLQVPDGDILIHGGDFCNGGSLQDALKFFNWFTLQPHKYKVLISGNHDVCMEKDQSIAELSMPTNIVYLKDSGVVIDGIKIWGSPYQPEFCNWAFNVKRGDAIQRHWDKIPADIDILITHGPAAGYLDQCPDMHDSRKIVNAGCTNLANTMNKVKPIVHIHGHIHGGYGVDSTSDILRINASVVNEGYTVTNKPVVFDYNFQLKQPKLVTIY